MTGSMPMTVATRGPSLRRRPHRPDADPRGPTHRRAAGSAARPRGAMPRAPDPDRGDPRRNPAHVLRIQGPPADRGVTDECLASAGAGALGLTGASNQVPGELRAGPALRQWIVRRF